MRSHFTASAFTRSANSFLREDERIDELRVEPFLRVGIVMDASCPGFPKSLPNSREIWRFSGLPARQAKEPGMELVNIPTALFRGVEAPVPSVGRQRAASSQFGAHRTTAGSFPLF